MKILKMQVFNYYGYCEMKAQYLFDNFEQIRDKYAGILNKQDFENLERNGYLRVLIDRCMYDFDIEEVTHIKD